MTNEQIKRKAIGFAQTDGEYRAFECGYKRALDDCNDELINSTVGWHKCIDGVPQDYDNHDWVLVRMKEKDTGWYNQLPYIAEYIKTTGEWNFREIDSSVPGYDYYRNLIAVDWKEIDQTEVIVSQIENLLKKDNSLDEIKNYISKIKKQ